MQAFSGWELYEQENSESLLTVGCDKIDNLLNGGLRKGITEISGEAGSGKTSLAMQLLFQCCLPKKDGGLNAKAVYLSTEGAPSKGRFDQLNLAYSQRYSNVKFAENILMHDVQNLKFQDLSLFHLLPKQAELNNVKLIVLDSVAAFYRLKTNYIERAKQMNRTRQQLCKLSFKYNMIVILINQVSDVFDKDILFTISSYGSVLSSNRRIKPTLGLAWSNVINTRIMLARTNIHQIYLKGSSSHIIRTFHVIYSPYIQRTWTNFEINQIGIRGIDQDKITKIKPIKQLKKHEIFDGMNDDDIHQMFGGSETQIENITITDINMNENDNDEDIDIL